MNIIGINGSPRKSGHTQKLLNASLEAAAREGAETEMIFLADYDIAYCRGCMACLETGYCRIADDFETLKDKVYAADGIVLASPTYGMKPTARMKNFLTDRMGMLAVYTSGLAGKYFAGIATAGGMGAGKVARELAGTYTNGFFKRAYNSGSLGVAVSKGFDMNAMCLTPEDLENARKLGRNMARDIRSGRTYPLRDLAKRFVMGNLASPMILKNIMANRNDKMKYVYRNLTERKLIQAVGT